MRMVAPVALALASLAAGCSRPPGENLGLAKRADAAIDVTRLTHADELVRALRVPGRAIDASYGARGFDATSSIKIEGANAPAESLDETYRFDSDGRGALRLVHDNSRGYGVDAIVLAGALYSRPRFGHYVRRKPEPDELDELRATVEGVAADYLDVLAPWLQVREAGAIDVAGRRAIKLSVSALAKPQAAREETDVGRAWRNTIKPRFVDGELSIDAKSGALVGARLDLAYSYDHKGAPANVTIAYKLQVAAPRAIEAPADVVDAPERARPMLDRQALLSDLPSRPKNSRGQHD